MTVRAGHAQAYTDEKTAAAENSFLAQALPYKPNEPLEKPLHVTLNFHFPIPASWSKKKKGLAAARGIKPTGKPDLDNCIKILDALNGVFWKDDSQIVMLNATKDYDAVPRTVVMIRELLI